MRTSIRFYALVAALGIIVGATTTSVVQNATTAAPAPTTTPSAIVVDRGGDPYDYIEQVIPDARETVSLEFVGQAPCSTETVKAAACADGESQTITIGLDSWEGLDHTNSRYYLIHEATHLAQWRYFFGSWEGATVALDEAGYGTTHARDGVTLLPSIEVHADCVALALIDDLYAAGYIDRCDPFMAYYGFTLVTGNGQLRGE